MLIRIGTFFNDLCFDLRLMIVVVRQCRVNLRRGEFEHLPDLVNADILPCIEIGNLRDSDAPPLDPGPSTNYSGCLDDMGSRFDHSLQVYQKIVYLPHAKNGGLVKM